MQRECSGEGAQHRPVTVKRKSEVLSVAEVRLDTGVPCSKGQRPSAGGSSGPSQLSHQLM